MTFLFLLVNRSEIDVSHNISVLLEFLGLLSDHDITWELGGDSFSTYVIRYLLYI
jgi:hypothetical protein